MIHKFFLAFLNLLFPNFCAFCQRPLRLKIGLCESCTEQTISLAYPAENYKLLTKLLQTPVTIHRVISLYYFVKDSPVQSLIHQMKYAGNVRQAHIWGKELSAYFTNLDIDGIIPIPLHSKRYKERGYNQSEEIARTLSQQNKIPLLNKIIRRIKYTESQAQGTKNLVKREENIVGAFQVNPQNKTAIGTRFQHILLVDDVMTTGATMREVIRSLTKVYPNLQISIAVIAATEGFIETLQ